jgi:hypothetical protein
MADDDALRMNAMTSLIIRAENDETKTRHNKFVFCVQHKIQHRNDALRGPQKTRAAAAAMTFRDYFFSCASFFVRIIK